MVNYLRGHLCANKEKCIQFTHLYVPIHQICSGKFRLLIIYCKWRSNPPNRLRLVLSSCFSLSFGEFPSLKTWTCCKCLNTKHRSWRSKTKHFNWHVQSQMWSLTCGELCGLEGNYTLEIMITPSVKEPSVRFSCKEKASLIPLMFQIGM